MTVARLGASPASVLLALGLGACGSTHAVADPPPSGADNAASPATRSATPAPSTPVADARASGERRCGRAGLTSCAANEYCDFPDGATCGNTDRVGVCRERPASCASEQPPAPVCSCDGRPHPSRCEAAMQGIDVVTDPPCSNPPSIDSLLAQPLS